ncbi:MAG: phospholipase D family protein [Clostridiales bacterium]|nr:phospholipase D family protein [Clostridiales bacterium]
MFDPKSSKDRVNYGEALLPPIGYSLERAVGTTYSLDLETLTAISIALGLVEDTDSELMNNPIGMLNALQKVSEKIVIFCEAGQIKIPNKANALCLMLEKMVVPVKLPGARNQTGYPAFHPKTWLLEYSNSEGEKTYRFVVMSRNLTFDHSWDVACALDGETVDYDDENSYPIQQFLKFLRKQLDKDLNNYERQYKELSYFIKIITKVQFAQDSKFSSFDLMPLGISENAYNMASDSLLKDNFHELVVMSPFISGGVISTFNDSRKDLTGTRRTLITRKSELPKISQGKASNFDVYVLKDDIVDGESAISEGDDTSEYEDITKQDIHAKLFIRRKNGDVDLYLGSMNATSAAISSNVEMVLRLKTRQHILSGEKFLTDIMGEDRSGKRNPFELVEIDEGYEEVELTAQDIVERVIKSVCRLKMHANVTPDDNGKFTLRLTAIYDNYFDCIIRIRPLRVKSGYKELANTLVFSNLDSLELSEFYAVSVTKDGCTLERVIMIPTEGIPEERDAEIIKSVINNRRAFIEYVAFVLGDDYVQSFLENKKSAGENGNWESGELVPAVYEKMLKASVSNPERIKEIQYITRVIEDDLIIPKEFTEMYKVFCDTLGIK